MEKKSRGFPNLDKYLNERGRKLVNYKEGAEIYGIPYYSFVRLTKEAGANYTLRKAAVIDIDVIEQYLDEHHKLPLAEGGTHDRSNLIALCKPCHSQIHAKRGDRWHDR